MRKGGGEVRVLIDKRRINNQRGRERETKHTRQTAFLHTNSFFLPFTHALICSFARLFVNGFSYTFFSIAFFNQTSDMSSDMHVNHPNHSLFFVVLFYFIFYID